MPAPPKLAVTYIPVADLHPYHRNPHKGNVKRIRSSLRDHAQFKPVVVNIGTHTGRPNEVLCGNHTLLAALEEGWTELGATTVDVSDDEAAKINLIDNPRVGNPSDLDYDDRLLLELLSDLPDLDGSGYDLGDLDDLAALFQENTPQPGTGGGNNQGTGPGTGGFSTENVRALVLAYPAERYVWMVDRLAELIAKGTSDNNADVVLALIERATGLTAPPEDSDG